MNQPRHRLAEPRRTPKKNVPCSFDFARGWIFSKMERTFFFGVLPAKIFGQCGGADSLPHFILKIGSNLVQ